MAKEQPTNPCHQDHLLADVKEEPPEEKETEISTLSSETVIKEKVTLQMEVDQLESVTVPHLEFFNKRPFKCLECDRSYDKLYNLNRCGKRHNAIRLELFKCKVCGKCSGTRKDNIKHENYHKNVASQLQSTGAIQDTQQDKSEDNSTQKTDCSNNVIEKVTVEDVIKERKAKERIVRDENGLFKCPECERTHKLQKNAVQCTRKHLAKRQGLYRCKICDLRTGTASNLRAHELTHKPSAEINSENSGGHSTETSKEHSLKCSGCNKTFDQLEDLLSCEKKCEIDRLTCKTCGKCCATKYHLERHEGIHKKKDTNKISKKLYKCSECNRTYSQRNLATYCIKKHLARRSGLYQCKFCNMCSATSYELRRHELTHKANTEPLQSVEATNLGSEQAEPLSSEKVAEALPEQLENQSLSKNSSEQSTKISKEHPFKCSECNRTFAQQSFVIKCEWKHKVIKLGRFKCKECGKCYASKYHLTEHEATHGSFKCPECNMSYKDQGKVTKCTNRHLMIRLGLYRCKFCNLCVESSIELKKHELTHQPNAEHTAEPKPYQCDLCKKTYRKKTGIRKHMRFHMTSEPRYKCRQCDETFDTNPERISHILRHSWDDNKRKYFAKLVEDDDGNHLCTICNQKFVKQTNAITHVFRHMNLIEGLLKCKTCGFKCPDTNFYKKHIKTHENPEEVPDASNENIAPQATDKDKDENNKNMDENSSTFCYETMIKEELIIEDEAFGESANNDQEKDSRNSLEVNKPMECEGTNQQEEELLELMEERSEPVESDEMSQQDETETFDTNYSVQKHNRTKKQVAKPQYEELLEQDKDSQNFKCLLCDKSYSNRYRALSHVQDHMNVIQAIFQCKICGLRCRANNQYRIHIKTHKDSTEYKIQDGVHIDYESTSDAACEKSDLPLHCKTCDVFFNSKNNLKIHLWKSKLKIIRAKIAAAGGELTERPKIEIDQDGDYKCSECDFKTKKLPLFKMHISGDHDSLFMCDVCQKHCQNLKDLKRHKRTHKKARYTCDLCQKCFISKKAIRKHMAVHITAGPRFECPECNEKFATIGERISHSVRHGWDETKQKYFAKLATDDDGKPWCTICDMKLVHRSSALAHVFRHMNVIEGLFQCEICGLRCPDTGVYQRHMKKHDNPPPPAAEKDSEEGNKTVDENSSSFCYETVIKEELIIEDDAIGESAKDEQAEDFHILYLSDDDQPIEDEATNQQEVEESRQNSPSHSESNMFKCDTCQKTFDNRRSLCTHAHVHKKTGVQVLYEALLIKSEESENYTCALCENPISTQKKHALGHVQRHVNIIKGIYRCKSCGLRSGTKSDYQLHLKNFNGSCKPILPPKGVYTEYDSSSTKACGKSGLPYHCITCNVVFNTENNFKNHLWKSKLSIIQSKIGTADEELQTKTPLVPRDFSKIQMDDNGFFNCSRCDYKSDKRSLFRIHVRKHKVAELGVYTCDVCQTRCKSLRILTIHKQSHERTGFTCRKCMEQFDNQSALKRHLYTHQSNRESHSTLKVYLGMDNLFHCAKCDKTFAARRKAYTHFETHGSPKGSTFCCVTCDLPFENNSDLEKHIQTHKEAGGDQESEGSYSIEIIEDTNFVE